jgi:DNA polymerase-3 subunit delta'
MPWHESAWNSALRALEAGRQHHALLIEGLPGSGRGAFAEALARRVLCDAGQAVGACGDCKSCELMRAGSHPDYLLVGPEEEGKAIGINAVRSAMGFINVTASFGARKVLLIQPAERLTTAAANAFLKSLEEPAVGTLILLVAARGHPLPATIRSRCQRVRLPEPEPAVAAAWLQQRLGHDKSAADSATAEQLLALFPGRPLLALRHSEGDERPALAALREFFLRCAGSGQAGSLERLRGEQIAASLAPDALIDMAGQLLAHWLRGQRAGDLRAPPARRAFAGVDRIAALRRARRAGQNPNAELLRGSVVAALLAPFSDGDSGSRSGARP